MRRQRCIGPSRGVSCRPTNHPVLWVIAMKAITGEMHHPYRPPIYHPDSLSFDWNACQREIWRFVRGRGSMMALELQNVIIKQGLKDPLCFMRRHVCGAHFWSRFPGKIFHAQLWCIITMLQQFIRRYNIQSFSTSVLFQFVSPHDIYRVMVGEEKKCLSCAPSKNNLSESLMWFATSPQLMVRIMKAGRSVSLVFRLHEEPHICNLSKRYYGSAK